MNTSMGLNEFQILKTDTLILRYDIRMWKKTTQSIITYNQFIFMVRPADDHLRISNA